MDARMPPDKKVGAPWKVFAAILFGIVMVVFSAYNLYEWYATGQIITHGHGTNRPWRSFAEEPIHFTFIATVYVSMFLLFGVGSVIKLIGWLWRRGRSPIKR